MPRQFEVRVYFIGDRTEWSQRLHQALSERGATKSKRWTDGQRAAKRECAKGRQSPDRWTAAMNARLGTDEDEDEVLARVWGKTAGPRRFDAPPLCMPRAERGKRPQKVVIP